jgi:hypothetical protein
MNLVDLLIEKKINCPGQIAILKSDGFQWQIPKNIEG